MIASFEAMMRVHILESLAYQRHEKWNFSVNTEHKKTVRGMPHIGMSFPVSKIDIYTSYQGRQNLINKSSL